MQDGRTALIQSAAKGHLDVVELLLKYGANKEHHDKVKRAGPNAFGITTFLRHVEPAPTYQYTSFRAGRRHSVATRS